MIDICYNWCTHIDRLLTRSPQFYIKIRFSFGHFFEFWLVHNALYPPLEYLIKSFHCPENPQCSDCWLVHPQLPTAPDHWSLYVNNFTLSFYFTLLFVFMAYFSYCFVFVFAYTEHLHSQQSHKCTFQQWIIKPLHPWTQSLVVISGTPFNEMGAGLLHRLLG